MRVLLVKPGRARPIGLERMSFIEPLGLEMVAACLPEHEVRILDLRASPRLGRVLDEFRPDWCGIGCAFTTEVRSALEVARQVKRRRPGCFTFMGGPHPSLCAEDFADPAVDAVVVGEAEATVPELAAALMEQRDLGAVPGLILNGPEGQRATEPRVPIADLDTLPFPARHLVARDRRRYYSGFQRPLALVETARGCPHRCTFCAVWRFHQGRVRYKSPARVVDELARVPAPYIFFTDDNFLGDVARAHEMADAVRAAGIHKTYTFQCRADTIARHPDLLEHWREVGRLSVFVGLEKIEQADLDDLHKRTTVRDNQRALDILLSLDVGFTPNFIVPPEADRSQFAQLREYVRARGLHGAGFSVLTPLPGTELYEQKQEELLTRDCELFDLFHAVTPTRLPLAEFYEEFASLYRAARTAHSRRRWHRLAKLLGAVASRRVSLSNMRRGMNVARTLSDPSIYLLGHSDGVAT
jgi:radical SAM superfamily enzyme YgiQ (UPF0313 family)